ncbi:MAG TPA: maleylpyruvate isomerase family mycothiol-dependent enzyme [Mycobacteriales bacterium]|nr:maleylpyruvate isomerase family mycothiol-dependent enzyme [Mycobacteriales bacterium]
MTEPSYTELVAAVRREGEGLVAAAGMGLDAAVPACEGWAVRDLVGHVAGIYNRIANLVSSRATESPERIPLPDGEPVAVLNVLLDDLVAELADCDPDTPMWNWSEGSPKVARFWARRMAHESAVHRFDAQSAHGVLQPVDADLAGDGIDELIDVIANRVYARDDVDGPTGTVRLVATDNDPWSVDLLPDGIRRSDGSRAADVTASGTSSALLLAAYARVPWQSLEVAGDATLLAAWTAALNF